MFDGNGNWTSDFSAQADRDNGIKILASRFDNIFIADIKESFENCLTKDGQIAPIGDFNMGGQKITNLANGTNSGDAVNKSQLDTKAADNTVVKLTGAQTIAGTKTFTSSPILPTPSTTDNSTKGATTAYVQNNLAKFTGIPNYSARTSFSSTTYTPAKNGIIRVLARGGNSYARIKVGTFVIASAQSTDSGSGTEAVWAIVKSGETYTVEYNGSAEHSFYFIPFV